MVTATCAFGQPSSFEERKNEMNDSQEDHFDRYRRKMIECLRQATRLTPDEYGDEPCFWDGGPGETGFMSGGLEEVRELAEAQDRPLPSWVWAAGLPHTIEVLTEDVLLTDADNLYSGAIDNISADAHTALQVLLDDWCARKDVQDATRSYDEDRSRVIVLDAVRFEEEIAHE